MFDEERDEFRREAYGIGEYRKGDPEKATGSPSSWNESGPPSWLRAMNQKRKSAEEARREPEPGPSMDEWDEIQARDQMNREEDSNGSPQD